jgi:serine/threonine protein kinase
LDTRLGLPVNTVLDGSYRVTRVVGVGGFGITYEAEDINLATQVAIKEYYPFDFGDRDATMSVRPKSERHRQTFDWGRSNFLQEARTLARFEHPSIVRVTRVFEANSTAYMVMRFERGQSFEAWLTGLGRPPTQEELDAIVAPLLAALELMHAADFLHRDIAPDNIIVRADGSPVLLDFGAARRAVAEMSRTMTGIVKAGYSPHEQYSSDSRLQGPWSDLYALGGTLYRAVSGHPPEEATLRVDEDHMPPAVQAAWKGRYRQSFLAGIDACLKVRHSERPRSVAQLRPMLLGKGSVSKPRLERLAEVFKTPSKPQSRPPSRPPAISGRTRRTGAPTVEPPPARRWMAVAAAVVALLGGAYGGYQFSQWDDPETARRKEVQRQAESKRKAEEEARARRQLEERQAAERLAAERAREEAERQEAERKRLAEAEAARKQAEEEAAAKARAEAEARRLAEERARQEAERKRLAEAEAARKRAEEEAAAKARAEAEARRLAEERARQEAERKRLAEEAERKRLAEAEAARKRAEQEDLARRREEERLAEQRRAAAERAQREAEEAAAARKAAEERQKKVASVDPSKTDDRSGSVTLNAEQRADFIRKVQAVLKDSQCYKGAVNGNSEAAQEGLDRFVETAQKKGKAKPGHIELAKATASDFDTWLRDANEVKSGLCYVPPKPKPPVQKAYSPPRRSGGGGGYGGGGYGGGGGGGAPIQGVR